MDLGHENGLFLAGVPNLARQSQDIPDDQVDCPAVGCAPTKRAPTARSFLSQKVSALSTRLMEFY